MSSAIKSAEQAVSGRCGMYSGTQALGSMRESSTCYLQRRGGNGVRHQGTSHVIPEPEDLIASLAAGRPVRQPGQDLEDRQGLIRNRLFYIDMHGPG